MRRQGLVLLILATGCAAKPEPKKEPVSAYAEMRAQVEREEAEDAAPVATEPAAIPPSPAHIATRAEERPAPAEQEPTQPWPRPTLEQAVEGCDNGMAGGCLWAGALTWEAEIERRGLADETSRRTADPYYRKACNLGMEEACDFAGLESGFHCFDGTAPNTRMVDLPGDGWCYRALNRCRTIRKELVGDGWTLAECQLQKKAACYSFRESLREIDVRRCFPTFQMCELWSEDDKDAAKNGRDIVKFKGCRAVK